MGYGLDTTKEKCKSRKWGSYIWWYLGGKAGKFCDALFMAVMDAMKLWESKINATRDLAKPPMVLFKQTGLLTDADFRA